MKKIYQPLFLFLVFIYSPLHTFSQVISEEDKRIMMEQIKKELLDSLKKDPEVQQLLLNENNNVYKKPEKSTPFAWGDFSWTQGNNRQSKKVLHSKYFTGDITVDCNYNLNFNFPIDHTNVGSTATFRANEFNISYIEAGGDLHYKGFRGRLMLQFGTRATGIPRNDNSALKGQFDLYNALRYVTEAYVGYRFNAMHGIEVHVGMFKSYIGLNSYNNFENWNYQPSFTSDNTPWFFTGARVQMYPSDKFKLELWLINGWQSYAMYNEAPGFGLQVDSRPKEWIKMIFNAYGGWDTPNSPNRFRFHSDNSIQIRYYNKPKAKFISKAAFALTADIGFEDGGGVVAFGGDSITPSQNFLSLMLFNRLWFGTKGKFAFTFGGGVISNPGRYLALLPTGNAVFTQNPGDQFQAWDASAGLQWMPTENITLGIEFVTRHSSVPYFSGRGGVTSPNGWNAPIGNPVGYPADLVNSENRLIFSTMFRL